MKLKPILIIFSLLIFVLTGWGQEYNVSLSSPESGTQIHQARNSITLLAGYRYTPGGSGMLAQIVNPEITGIVSFNNPPVDPASRTLNTDYLAGTTPGAFNVNQAGGASYTIPLDMLQGVNGLTPSLSLVYSGNSGPGMAGYGWQIGGLSVISRAGKNFYNDGMARGIELDYNDKFYLDGQRLVPTSGTYGYDQTTYQTESDIFTRVQSQNTSGNGPMKFMAQTKAGLKNLYGYTDDGCQRIDGYSEILNWYVTQTQDLWMNTINYAYLRNGNMIYPREITYGPNKITFNYKQRPDVTTSYLKGKTIRLQLLLDKVIISYNSNVVKTYEMKYVQITNNYNSYSALNEVIESGTGGTRLNSTVFSYQTPANVDMYKWRYNNYNNFVSYKSRLCTGDFNGDGKADVFTIDNKDVSDGNYSGWTLQINDGNGNFTKTSGDFSIDESEILEMYAVDLNSDGRQDLILKIDLGTAYWNGMIYPHVEQYLYSISSGSSLNPLVDIGNALNSSLYYKIDNNHIGDFNGDGLCDILIIHNSDGYWSVYSFTYTNGNLNPLTRIGNGQFDKFSNDSKRFVSDFNGDGLAEISTIDVNGITAYKLNGSSFSLVYCSNFPASAHNFQVGDFNGDSKTDFFVYGFNNVDWPVWQINLSNGSGLEPIFFPAKKSNLKDDIVRTGDFNGDGCTDLMVTASTDNGWSGHYYYISQEYGKNFYSCFLPNSGSPSNTASNSYFLNDFNGDGRTEYLCIDGTSNPWWNGFMIYAQNGDGSTTPMLHKVANGLNTLTTVNYTRLSQASGSVYNIGLSNPAFPVFNYQGPLPVVSSLTVDNGLGSSNILSYYYEGACIHQQGKGFLCFSKTVLTDVSDSLVNETLSDFNTTYYYPQVNTVTSKTSAGTTIETTANSWTQTVLDSENKRIFPYISSSTQTNSLTSYSITQTSQFDNYGNPTRARINYNNGIRDSTIVNYTNTVNSTEWKLGRTDNSTVYNLKSGETTVSHSVRYTYSTDGILKPDYIYYNEGTPLAFTKNHDYNSQGNLIQVVTSGTSIGTSQVSSIYDTDYIRLKTKTDELGHTVTLSYNSYGQLLTEKDYLNNTNTYAYDALGRETSATNSDGSQTTTAYVWAGTHKPSLGSFGVSQTRNDGSVQTTWYDKLQRAIRSEKKGFDGQMILIDTEYYPAGQLHRVSDPYYANGARAWAETYGYDAYGRTTSITRNSGRNSSYTYDNGTINESTVDRFFSKNYGPDGSLIWASDRGGAISYAYYPDRKVKSITAPDGSVTSMQYADAARNQTQLLDPSAGTINYTYDALRRVKTHTDARNKVTTYTYLADGRLDKVVNPEGTTSYSYNTNKQLSGITNTSAGVSRTYGYDSKGRITGITETISVAPFSTSFTYDQVGRLQTRTYPSAITETFGYNIYGYLSSFSTGGSVRYSITGMNPRQQVTGVIYGDGTLTGTHKFDGYGYPIEDSTGTVHNYGYSFNSVTGNLNSRQNYKRNLSESFDYSDGLDCLTSVTGPINLSMTYAANGNILTKSDINATTAFTYGAGAGPYALTKVTSSTGVIPAVSQTATYSSFEKVNTFSQGAYAATFAYNSDNQRAKMVVTQSGSTILTRWYAGSSYIKQTEGSVTKEFTWIGGDAYTAPVLAITQSGTTTYYYLLRDHLGSITHVTDASGNVLNEYSFDAWGRRRDYSNWGYSVASQTDILPDRGFTGHEYLKYFNLYNMNGRLYDPLIARFLNVDPYVQMPDNSQSLNRYSYCLNNPLVYTDPSGEFIFTAFLGPVGAIIDAACWGAVIGGAGYTASVAFSDGGFNNWNSGAFWKSVGVGAISGAITGGVGQMFGPVGSMGFGGEIARAYTHGFAQGMVSEFTGGDFMTGFAAGGLGSLAGSSFMMYGGKFASSTFGTYAFSGLAGGVGAELTGGNFWEGAAVGVMNAGLNHLQSVVGEAGARYYANKKAGYGDMWNNSFVDGKATREVSAWELENGDTIMLPYDKNDLTTSYNDALKVVKIDGKRYVQFNGKTYALATHAHTHPSMAGPNAHPIGLSQADLNMQKFIGRPINILYNKGIYSVNGTYNYKAKVWNYKYTGTW